MVDMFGGFGDEDNAYVSKDEANALLELILGAIAVELLQAHGIRAVCVQPDSRDAYITLREADALGVLTEPQEDGSLLFGLYRPISPFDADSTFLG